MARTCAREPGFLQDETEFQKQMESVVSALRDRMRFYKLRISHSAIQQCHAFNSDAIDNAPETIHDHNDPGRVEWLRARKVNKDYVVGDEVLRAADPEEWLVRWPIARGFNTAGYASKSVQEVLGDMELIWVDIIEQKLGIPRKDFPIYNVILVVPDLCEPHYLSTMTTFLLRDLGFRQLAPQPSSLAAAYGAGLGTALVVDVGAHTTSIACVDEGFLIADTRLNLDLGGDDITELLLRLLGRAGNPWAASADLSRLDTWLVAEKLKYEHCSLAEEHVALNPHSFTVRGPGAREATKWRIKTYDEPVLAAMVLFEPQAVDYDAKRARSRPVAPPDGVTEEMIETAPGEVSTQAMAFSTQHLQPHVDVPRESAKLPLDVGVFNSARASGGEEKVRKMLSNVLLVGGGAAKIGGVNSALETRLAAIAQNRVLGLERLADVPAQMKIQTPTTGGKVDSRVLCWKGGSVLARMDTVNDFWICKEEWDMVGQRGTKERWWYMSL
ncbi:actin-like ATPase domain-containing protein [Auricularia subglabra TFB-10046 SS5]|nr:actin-like ATPase domain-containing protein [Auricularia subglabra TFB-10046 SS5]